MPRNSPHQLERANQMRSKAPPAGAKPYDAIARPKRAYSTPDAEHFAAKFVAESRQLAFHERINSEHLHQVAEIEFPRRRISFPVRPRVNHPCSPAKLKCVTRPQVCAVFNCARGPRAPLEGFSKFDRPQPAHPRDHRGAPPRARTLWRLTSRNNNDRSAKDRQDRRATAAIRVFRFGDCAPIPRAPRWHG